MTRSPRTQSWQRAKNAMQASMRSRKGVHHVNHAVQVFTELDVRLVHMVGPGLQKTLILQHASAVHKEKLLQEKHQPVVRVAILVSTEPTQVSALNVTAGSIKMLKERCPAIHVL